MQNDKRSDTQWTVDKVFQDEPTGLMVRVQKLALRKPQYSIEIGQVRKDKDFSRYLRPQLAVNAGVVTIKSFDRTALSLLLDAAEEHVEKETQRWEEEHKDEPVREQGGHRDRRNGRRNSGGGRRARDDYA